MPPVPKRIGPALVDYRIAANISSNKKANNVYICTCGCAFVCARIFLYVCVIDVEAGSPSLLAKHGAYSLASSSLPKSTSFSVSPDKDKMPVPPVAVKRSKVPTVDAPEISHDDSHGSAANSLAKISSNLDHKLGIIGYPQSLSKKVTKQPRTFCQYSAMLNMWESHSICRATYCCCYFSLTF